MKGQAADYHAIERYLDHEMEKDELQLFNKWVEADKQLEIQIASVKESRKIVFLDSILQFKKVIEAEEIKYNSKRTIHKKGIVVFLLFLFLSGALYYSFFIREINQTVGEKNKIVKNSKTSAQNLMVGTSGELRPPAMQKIKKDNKEIKPVTVWKEERALPTDELPAIKKEDAEPHTGIDAVLPQVTSSLPDRISVEEKHPADICMAKMIQGDVIAKPSCAGEHNGMVIVEMVSGGKPPYRFSLNNISDQTGNIFSKLPAGRYNLVIKDGEGCQKIYQNITVSSENCSRNYEFNPLAGETWEVPQDLGTGLLTIYDAAGNKYLSKKIDPDTKEVWSGLSPAGSILPGYYIFVIEHEDGSQEKGSITVAGR